MSVQNQCFVFFSIFLCISVCFGEDYDLDDKTGLGRSFDGIGGLSGGGVSVLLYFSFLSQSF